jgi:hypothetical protein
MLLAAASSSVAQTVSIEHPLESGARVLMVGHPGEAGEGDSRIAVAVAVPVGWADAGGPLPLQLAARFAVTAEDGSSSFTPEVLPLVTLFCGTIRADAIEAELAELVRRLAARECDEATCDGFDHVVRKLPPPCALDRLREAAAPGSAEGSGPYGRRPRIEPDLSVAAETEAARSRMLEFLAARVGSEGSVVAMVGAAAEGAAALAAARALEGLPRARGVAPPPPTEASAEGVRRVAAPSGVLDGALGVRLAWNDDPLGDRLALAAAFVAEAIGPWPEVMERDRLGGLLAFQGHGLLHSSIKSTGTRATTLSNAIGDLDRTGLSAEAFDRVLGRLGDWTATIVSTPEGMARQLALDGVLYARPDAALDRVARWRAVGRVEAETALRQQLRPQAVVEVVPQAEGGR